MQPHPALQALAVAVAAAQETALAGLGTVAVALEFLAKVVTASVLVVLADSAAVASDSSTR
jgi:hypothetical protein